MQSGGLLTSSVRISTVDTPDTLENSRATPVIVMIKTTTQQRAAVRSCPFCDALNEIMKYVIGVQNLKFCCRLLIHICNCKC